MYPDEPQLIQQMHQQPHWAGEERRGIDGITLKLMAEVRVVMEKHEQGEAKTFSELKADIYRNREDSETRHAEVLARFSAMQESTMSMLQTNNGVVTEVHRLFREAFPEGDVAGHRKAHEHWIKKEQEDREFWLKLKQNTVNAAVLAVAGWAGLAVWAAFLRGPQ